MKQYIQPQLKCWDAAPEMPVASSVRVGTSDVHVIGTSDEILVKENVWDESIFDE